MLSVIKRYGIRTGLVAALLIVFTVCARATAQYPDKIIYSSKEYSLNTNPLEAYFEKNPGKRPKTVMTSSALWRGYVATFIIKDNQLFVTDIQIQVSADSSGKSYATRWKSVMKEVFPDEEEVKADWFTGILTLPYGKVVNYVHMGYGSTYANYVLLEINEGQFVQEKKYSYKEYEQFKDRQFEAFRKTEAYSKLVAQLTKEGTSPEFIDNFLRSYITDYTTRILTK